MAVPTSAASPAVDAAASCHAVTSGAWFVEAGASTPVLKTCSSLMPVFAPPACVTVMRTASPVTSGNCTWLRFARGWAGVRACSGIADHSPSRRTSSVKSEGSRYPATVALDELS